MTIFFKERKGSIQATKEIAGAAIEIIAEEIVSGTETAAAAAGIEKKIPYLRKSTFEKKRNRKIHLIIL